MNKKHKTNCNNCGKEFDMRYLNQVLIHENCKDKKKDTWYNEEQTNKRMNVIGQNGNDGTHYETK